MFWEDHSDFKWGDTTVHSVLLWANQNSYKSTNQAAGIHVARWIGKLCKE